MMNALILSNIKNSKRNNAILEEVKKNGLNCEVVNPLNCNIVIKQNKTEVYNRNKLIEPSFVFPFYHSATRDISNAILHAFESDNRFKLINSLESVQKSKNKLSTLIELSKYNIPIPNSIVRNKYVKINEIKDYLKADELIIKGLYGSQGSEVMYPVNQSHLDFTYNIGKQHIVQKFIKESYGTHIRVFYLYGEIIACIKRVNSNDFRSNAHQGSFSEKVILTQEEKDISISTAKILGLNLAGIDMLRSNDGPLILEVNSSPSFESISKDTGIDIAKIIVQKFINNK